MAKAFDSYEQYLKHKEQRLFLTRAMLAAPMAAIIPPSVSLAMTWSEVGVGATIFEMGFLILVATDFLIERRHITVARQTYLDADDFHRQRLDMECLDKTSVGQDPGLIAPRSEHS